MIISFGGTVFAQTAEDKPIQVLAKFSFAYDDNVFEYSQRFRERSTKSIGDLISEPSLELRFRPLASRYFPTLSAGLSGHFYGQNSSLNDRSVFIAIDQEFAFKTDISVTYNDLFLESTKQALQTVGIYAQTDFDLFQWNLSADVTEGDKNYGTGVMGVVPILSSETIISYQLDVSLPVDKTWAYRSHTFRVEPGFSVTEDMYLSLYADIQKKGFTATMEMDNFQRNDLTLGLGLNIDYQINEKVSTQLGYERTRWDTSKVARNQSNSYEKNIITIKISTSL